MTITVVTRTFGIGVEKIREHVNSPEHVDLGSISSPGCSRWPYRSKTSSVHRLCWNSSLSLLLTGFSRHNV